MKKHIGVVIVGISIFLFLMIFWLSFTVRWQEKALVISFGKISRVETEPGLKWMWPWQEVVTFDGRIGTLQQKGTQTQTSDQQNIIVSVYVNWRISKPDVFYKRFRSAGVRGAEDVVAGAKKTIGTWVTQASNVFARYDLGELVTVDASQFKLAEIEVAMLAQISAQAASEGGYGVEITDLGISRLGVPDSVSASVFERMRADRSAEIARLMSEGQAEAASITSKAEAQATMIAAEAQALAREIEGQGDAVAAESYPVFLANTRLASFLRQIATLRRTLGEGTTIVIDAKTAPYNLLKSGPEILSQDASGAAVD